MIFNGAAFFYIVIDYRGHQWNGILYIATKII